MANDDTNEEAILGTLINRCGKMRMLSHRVVVTLLLEGAKENPCSEAMGELEQDLTEFSKIASDVTPGSKKTSVPGNVQGILEKVDAVSRSQNDTLVQFLTNARLIQQRLKEKGGSHLNKIIQDLAQFVKTTLLATLNSIVEGINRALDYVVSTRQSQAGKQTKMLRSSISELEKISRMIMIISVNASIEASRVGEAGRGFSAVATEIRGLSQSANNVISTLRTQFENQ